MLLRLLVYAGVALVVWFVFSQMLNPAFKNTPSFPFFRRIFRRKAAVTEEIRGLHAKGELTELEKKAEALKRKQQQKAKVPKKKEQN